MRSEALRPALDPAVDVWLGGLGLQRGSMLGSWKLATVELDGGERCTGVVLEFANQRVTGRVVRIRLQPTDFSGAAFARSASFDLSHENVRDDLLSAAAKLVRVVYAIVVAHDRGGLSLPSVPVQAVAVDAAAPAVEPAAARASGEPSAAAPRWYAFYGESQRQTPRFPTAEHRAHLDRTVEIAEDVRADFRRNGHVIVRGALDPEVLIAARAVVVTALRDALHGSAAQHTLPIAERDDTYSGSSSQITHFGAHDAAIRVLTQSRRLAKVAADLMGVRRVRLFCEDWFIKEARADSTPWHQDSAGMPFDAAATITVWIPFQPVKEGMGLLRFVRGSHRHGIQLVDRLDPDARTAAPQARSAASAALPVNAEVKERAMIFHFVPERANAGQQSADAREAAFEDIIRANDWTIDVSPTLALGDLSVHDGSTIHAGLSNDSDEPRIALALHCFADGAALKAPVTPAMRNFRRLYAPELQNGAPAVSSFWPLLYQAD